MVLALFKVNSKNTESKTIQKPERNTKKTAPDHSEAVLPLYIFDSNYCGLTRPSKTLIFSFRS